MDLSCCRRCGVRRATKARQPSTAQLSSTGLRAYSEELGSTDFFSRQHPREHSADPPEHLERSVGLSPQTEPGAAYALTGMFVLRITRAGWTGGG
eukprot:5492248-Prymnesium_polylepis.1